MEAEIRHGLACDLKRVWIESERLINAPDEVPRGMGASLDDVQRVTSLIVRYGEMGHRFFPRYHPLGVGISTTG